MKLREMHAHCRKASVPQIVMLTPSLLAGLDGATARTQIMILWLSTASLKNIDRDDNADQSCLLDCVLATKGPKASFITQQSRMTFAHPSRVSLPHTTQHRRMTSAVSNYFDPTQTSCPGVGSIQQHCRITSAVPSV